MIKVNICGSEHDYDSSLASWISEQFHNRTSAGAHIWFVISVAADGIKLRLPSAGAPRGRGAPYSHFNPRERKIIDMWNEMGLDKEKNVSYLLRFLDQLRAAVA